MRYHDNFLLEYKKIVNPKDNWIIHMSKTSKLICGTAILICIKILISMFIVIWVIPNMAWLINLILLGTIYCLLKWILKKVTAEKEEIAKNIYNKENWNEVRGEQIKKYKNFLREKNIVNKDQIDIILLSIEEELKEKTPKKLITLGAAGAFILPAWNELIKSIFEDTNIQEETIETKIILFIGIVFFVGFAFLIINMMRKIYLEVRNPNIYRLFEIKHIFIDMKLEYLSLKEEV